MAEKQNNAVATAGNIAHKLHGTAQIVRGAVTADSGNNAHSYDSDIGYLFTSAGAF